MDLKKKKNKSYQLHEYFEKNYHFTFLSRSISIPPPRRKAIPNIISNVAEKGLEEPYNSEAPKIPL